MAQKSKKKIKKVVKNPEYLKQIRNLETDLSYTLKAALSESQELEKLFTNQANRLVDRIKKLKESQ